MKIILFILYVNCLLSDPLDGYTLITSGFGNGPNATGQSMLIDNDENIINVWEHDTRPSSISYLMPDSTLYTPCRPIGASGGQNGQGPSGGRFKKTSWDGDIIWDYTLPDDVCMPHHDIVILPNGNILAICFETKDQLEAESAGFYTNGGDLILDMIIEIEPIGTNDANIVWEWHFWDHLIQDQNTNSSNYGNISESPQLLDINYPGQFEPSSSGILDWNHTNCISYNHILDQIVISARHMNEIYIIDHSTTISEAASHTGGNSGKGGDFLYRWGNPQNYNRGTDSDQILGAQHGVNWIPQGYPGEGNLILFNNFHTNSSSAVLEIITPINSNGVYDINEVDSYAPESHLWIYESDFFSNKQSGAFRLSNGNTLITSDQDSRLFEVDIDGNIVWEYTGDLDTARAIKYSVDYFNDSIYGDLNNDEIINVLDIILLVNIILDINETQTNADLNFDGFINVLDIIQLVNLILD